MSSRRTSEKGGPLAAPLRSFRELTHPARPHQPPVSSLIPHPSPVHVTEINSLDQLQSCRLAWTALLAKTRGANYFQTLDWLLAYWRHFGNDQELRTLVIQDDRRAVLGILPLVLRRESTRAGTVRVLTYPLHGWGSFYGPIGPNPTLTLAAGMLHVARTRHDWDLVDLRWVDADNSDHARTDCALLYAELPYRKHVWGQTAWIDLRGGWEAYWQSRKSHWRTNVRHAEKQLVAVGQVEHVRYRPAGAALGEADPRWDLYDACERLAELSWQGKSTTGTTLSHTDSREYFRDAHQTAAAAGGLDLNLLYVAGRPAAFAYNVVHHGSVFGLRTGYHPQFAKAGAGTVLMARMLSDSCRLGDTLFDLGPGNLETKRHWQTSVENCYRYTHYRATAVRAQLLRAKHWWTQGRGLDSRGLKSSGSGIGGQGQTTA